MPSSQNKVVDVVLVSLGTPESPDAKSIRAFLRRFLSDKRVIEAPRLIWLPVLYGIILPFRPRKLKHAYQQISEQFGGSPLRIIAKQQAQALQQLLDCTADANTTYHVFDVMVYDKKNVTQFLLEREGLGHKTIVLPLYPQYSATTTASVYDQVSKAQQKMRNITDIYVVKSYFEESLYQLALKGSVETFWNKNGKNQHLLISFHGIPQEYVDKGDPYYQQCQQTGKKLAQDLNLSDQEYTICFQSRLGPKQWLQPYTDKTIIDLANKGIKNIDVVCPSFSADCLETLEEIAVEAKQDFVVAGGKNLRLIPSLNANKTQIELFKKIVETHQ